MNLELVEQIVALIGEYPVSEVSVEQDGRRISVRRSLTASASRPSPAPAGHAESGPLADAAAESVAADLPSLSPEGEAAAPPVPEETRTLTATMVGIFHHAAPPIPYAAVLTPGQVIGSIESMKLMNDVLAEYGGRVTDVLVEDGAPVEYGQALFRLATA